MEMIGGMAAAVGQMTKPNSRGIHIMDISSLGIGSVTVITAICFLVGQIVKASGLNNKWIPIVCGVVGGVLGVVALYIPIADLPARDPLSACAVGIVSGLAATGINQVYKQLTNNKGE